MDILQTVKETQVVDVDAEKSQQPQLQPLPAARPSQGDAGQPHEQQQRQARQRKAQTRGKQWAQRTRQVASGDKSSAPEHGDAGELQVHRDIRTMPTTLDKTFHAGSWDMTGLMAYSSRHDRSS
ncbi:hypothetical protein D3C78_1647260 [compost metagenome]